MKAICYYRVSTQKQGDSGLGLEAQQFAVQEFIRRNAYQVIGEFTEIESGKKDQRPQLAAAIQACKREKAILIIAKLDRLSRNVAFIANLMESKVKFKAIDMPEADDFILHILAAVAQREREMISKRTTDALQAAKRRGIKLGSHGKVLAAKNKEQADQDARAMAATIEDLRSRGITSVRRIAAELGRHPTSVQRILSRLK